MYKPEYLINSKSFDDLENNNMSNDNNFTQNNNTSSNSNTTNITDTNTYTFKHNKKEWINQREKDFVKKNIEKLKKYIMQKSKQNNSKSKSKTKSKDKNPSKRNTINYNSRINNSNNISNSKRTIELVLYDDAVKKKRKK